MQDRALFFIHDPEIQHTGFWWALPANIKGHRLPEKKPPTIVPPSSDAIKRVPGPPVTGEQVICPLWPGRTGGI